MRRYLRNIDPLGRIAIPKEILKANRFEEESLFHVRAIPEGILLCPADGSCALCGGTDDLLESDGEYVCLKCAEKIEAAVKQR